MYLYYTFPLLSIFSPGTLISIGYDHVTPSPHPCAWNLSALFAAASLSASVACVSSIVMLSICLHSWQPDSVMLAFGVGKLSYGHITTVMYLKVSVSDFLTLFSSRTPTDFFWSTRPSAVLLVAAIFALTMSTIIACAWPPSHPDDLYTLGLGYQEPKSLALFVWCFCLLWWFIQDGLKVLFYKLMVFYNLFGINDTNNASAKSVKIRETSNHVVKVFGVKFNTMIPKRSTSKPLLQEDELDSNSKGGEDIERGITL